MWVDWLGNESSTYAAYRAVNTACTIALDKTPSVQPLGVRESWLRLWSDCSDTKTKVVATTACGNTQLCTGLWSGIKANLHTVRALTRYNILTKKINCSYFQYTGSQKQ